MESLLRQAFSRLGGWQRTMILSHQRPDGDALGAMAAMKRLLAARGHSPTAFIYEPIPPRYAFLDAGGAFTPWPGGPVEPLESAFDGVLILDTCSWSQLEPVAAFLRATRLPRIVIDHHATHDDLSPGAAADDLYVIAPAAASVCVSLYRGCVAMGWPVRRDVAEALFAGIATDTGWFRFPNTDATTLQIAGELLAAGVPVDVMHARLMAAYSPARLRLMGEMLATLEFHAGGAVAVMSLSREMFARAGAGEGDTEDLVNEPMAVGQVMVSVLLSETGDGRVRVNLRSKSPELTGREIDVAAIAGAFGGGGHPRAAGARVAGNLADIRQQVLNAILAALRPTTETQRH